MAKQVTQRNAVNSLWRWLPKNCQSWVNVTSHSTELSVVTLCMYFGGWCRMLSINLISLKLGKQKYVSLKAENHNIHRENTHKNEILLCNEAAHATHCQVSGKRDKLLDTGVNIWYNNILFELQRKLWINSTTTYFIYKLCM